MEHPKRKELEEELLKTFKKNLAERYEGVLDVEKEKEADAILASLYLEPLDGCLPNEFIGEEILHDIQSKFYEFFSTIRDSLKNNFLEKQGFKDIYLPIYIDPSYEGSTEVIIPFQRLVVLEYSCKPWHFAWPSISELKRDMADLYYEMRDRLNLYFWEGIRYERNKN